MPKPALVSHPTGQRASVAAFMLLMLSAATLLAYGASYRPPVVASFQGLAWGLPNAWSVTESGSSTFGVWREFASDRRPELNMRVNDLGALPSALSDMSEDTEAQMFRWWFKVLTFEALPEEQDVQRAEIDGLIVRYWSGLARPNWRVWRQNWLANVAIAIVVDPQRNHWWSVSLWDRNYRHEDPREKVPQHLELFEAIVESMRPAGESPAETVAGPTLQRGVSRDVF